MPTCPSSQTRGHFKHSPKKKGTTQLPGLFTNQPTHQGRLPQDQGCVYRSSDPLSPAQCLAEAAINQCLQKTDAKAQ